MPDTLVHLAEGKASQYKSICDRNCVACEELIARLQELDLYMT